MTELRLLRVFVEVAEQLSFTRAAEKLYLRQQTVSQMVRDLERELGVELLERTTRQVRITPAGLRLLEDGKAVLHQADVAFSAARAVGTGQGVTVDVGATVAIGTVERAEVVDSLRRDRPDRGVTMREVTPANVGDNLRQHVVECALTRTSGTTDATLEWVDLRPTAMLICLPASHRLAKRTSIRAADLDGERLLIPSPVGKPYADTLLTQFQAAGAVMLPVQSHVTGGAVLLANVNEYAAAAVMPVGTACPPGVVGVVAEDAVLPLRLLWSAGRKPGSVTRLIHDLGKDRP